MKISYKWLNDYLESGLLPDKMSSILTSIGLEVDQVKKIESVRGGLEGVVVGEVLTCGKHPDADRLKITTVDVGTGEPLQIVCGAPNVEAGQKVLVATVNTTLFPKGESEGFKIKKSKIRGVESLGMICTEDELGLGEDHEGIMVLESEAVAGTPAREYLSLEDDYMIEIGLTPNRVDAASHYGVAWDLFAYLKSNNENAVLSFPDTTGFSVDNHDRQIEVIIENTEAAPRYTGVTITDVKIAPSPQWMQNYLRAIGINPKNNVVDITNFVLYELGQPLHAFDADKIEGDRIIVKTCEEGTVFTTLDETERKLSDSDLMICSSERPMCIGGVFGGLDSGVTESTRNIFLESAYFNPGWVRRTARRHGLSTDSAFRFERGVDPQMTITALKRAAILIRELAGGKISSEITDIYPVKIEPFRFDISLDYVDMLVGKHIPAEKVCRILDALEIIIEKTDGNTLSVSVPLYRVDVRRPADLVEEILRIYGYNNVEIPERVNASIPVAPRPDRKKIINTASDFLSSRGFTEIMSNSLTRSAYYEGLSVFKPENSVQILNPLSSDLNVLRQTLLFNMLEAVQLNSNRRSEDLKLYEFGNCYFYDPAKKADGGLAPYKEIYNLGICITGDRYPSNWNIKTGLTDFYDLKATAELLLKRFGIDIYDLECETSESDIYREALKFSVNSKEFFTIGRIADKLMRGFDLKNPVFFLELNFDLLIKTVKNKKITVEELSRFPEVRRDLALLVDKSVTYSALRKIAFSAERKLLKQVSLFDVYEGEKLPEGKKSYALSFILEDKSKTLTDNIIDKTMNNLISRFEKEAGATIRS